MGRLTAQEIRFVVPGPNEFQTLYFAEFVVVWDPTNGRIQSAGRLPLAEDVRAKVPVAAS